jgi:hypothetical protein
MSTRQIGTLLKQCGRGSRDACAIAKQLSVLYAGSVVTFDKAKIDANHPNKLPFSGILLLVDEASQKAPHGSEGHRIYVSKKAALQALEDIVGMGINYQPGNLDAHATRHKVGVVTKAWLEGNEVKVSGFIWDRDFPEADKELKGRNDLGMSMELSDVYVDDENAQIWNLTKFRFTGATILKKDAAAYSKTSLAAQAYKSVKHENGNYKVSKVSKVSNITLAAANATRGKGEKMPKHDKEKKVAAARRDTGQSSGDTSLVIQAMGGQLSAALQNVMGPLVNEVKASNQRVQEGIEELNGRLRLADVQAAAENDDDDEIVLEAAGEDDSSDDDVAAAEDASDDDSDDVAAAARNNDDDDSSDDSSDGSSDYQAMEDLSLEDASEEPGEVNQDASNRGKKTSVTKPPKQGAHFKGNVAEGRIHGKGMKGSKVGKKPFGGMDAAAVKLETMYAASEKRARKLVRINAALVQDANKKIKKLSTQNRTIMAQLERFSDAEARRSAVPHELVNLAAKSGFNLGELKASGQKMSVEAADGMFAAARAQGINISPEQRIAMKMQMEEYGLLDQGVVDRGYGRPN